VWTVGLTVAAFSNFSGVVWTLTKMLHQQLEYIKLKICSGTNINLGFTEPPPYLTEKKRKKTKLNLTMQLLLVVHVFFFF